MITARSSADPGLQRRDHPSGGWVTTFVGTHHRQLTPGAAPADPQAPVAFLVEQGAHYVVRPHFHAANQFQVFVVGNGVFGKEPFASPLVHYASAHTPYGPIAAGAEGVAYFTLRDGFDPGPRYMPESRELLRAQRRGTPAHAAAAVADPDGVGVHPMIALRPDGMGSWQIRLPAGKAVAAPNPALGGGQFWIVLKGELRIDDTDLPAHSCLYRSPDEQGPSARAGASGLALLIVQFPRRLAPAPSAVP